ncbi:MAG: hypothetical protein PHQ32_03565 [Firmicutes bacterium]|nr:hypothetical protein [Bacillota bacterium]
MEEEIDSSLQIENIEFRRINVRNILNGMAPINEEENRILGMKKGLEFISNPKNKINEINHIKKD